MLLWLIVPGLIAGAGVVYFNRLVRARQLLQEAESGIDVQLKRRHDLIPNLIEVVKGYAAHEKNVLENVTRLRTQAADLKAIDKERAGLENQLTRGLKTIFALAEAYPDLKADGQFINLHKNLTQVEDELQMARRYYNGTVRDLNVLVQSFPGNIVASSFQFKAAEFFEIETVTERAAPEVRL